MEKNAIVDLRHESQVHNEALGFLKAFGVTYFVFSICHVEPSEQRNGWLKSVRATVTFEWLCILEKKKIQIPRESVRTRLWCRCMAQMKSTKSDRKKTNIPHYGMYNIRENHLLLVDSTLTLPPIPTNGVQCTLFHSTPLSVSKICSIWQ